ncbi:MAG: hypothetical protein KAU60_03585, partial [Desulfobacterales bacterium]|nr:hypothetical protein [Desulfobacterales bacterium]
KTSNGSQRYKKGCQRSLTTIFDELVKSQKHTLLSFPRRRESSNYRQLQFMRLLRFARNDVLFDFLRVHHF